MSIVGGDSHREQQQEEEKSRRDNGTMATTFRRQVRYYDQSTEHKDRSGGGGGDDRKDHRGVGRAYVPLKRGRSPVRKNGGGRGRSAQPPPRFSGGRGRGGGGGGGGGGRGQQPRLSSEYTTYPGEAPTDHQLAVSVYMRHDPRQYRDVNALFINDVLQAALTKISRRQCVRFNDDKYSSDADAINETRLALDRVVHECAGVKFSVHTASYSVAANTGDQLAATAPTATTKNDDYRSAIDSASIVVFDATPFCVFGGAPVVDHRLIDAAKRYMMQTRVNLSATHARSNYAERDVVEPKLEEQRVSAINFTEVHRSTDIPDYEIDVFAAATKVQSPPTSAKSSSLTNHHSKDQDKETTTTTTTDEAPPPLQQVQVFQRYDDFTRERDGPMGAVYDRDNRLFRTTETNIALEIGYAMRTKRPDQIVLLVNTAYGTPESLPTALLGGDGSERPAVFTYTMMMPVHHHQYVRRTPAHQLPDEQRLAKEHADLKRKTLNLVANELSYYIKQSIFMQIRRDLIERACMLLDQRMTTYSFDKTTRQFTCWVVLGVADDEYTQFAALWNDQLAKYFGTDAFVILAQLPLSSSQLSVDDRARAARVQGLSDEVYMALTTTSNDQSPGNTDQHTDAGEPPAKRRRPRDSGEDDIDALADYGSDGDNDDDNGVQEEEEEEQNVIAKTPLDDYIYAQIRFGGLGAYILVTNFTDALVSS